MFSKLDAIRFRRLGGSRVGVLHQGQRAGRGRGRAVHRQAHHPGGGAHVRRFRRQRRRSRHQPHAAGDWWTWRTRTCRAGGCGSAWSAAGAARSSARCIASPPAWTTVTNWWPARSPPIRERALQVGSRSAYRARPQLREFAEMAERKRARPRRHRGGGDRDAEPLHFAPAQAFLAARHPCDLRQAADPARWRTRVTLAAAVAQQRLVFGLTHNYTGYPAGPAGARNGRGRRTGRIRVVQVEYPQDWLTTRLEATGQKQAAWRTDPARSGAAGCVGDIGTHAFNLAEFVSGAAGETLAADLTTFVEGRPLDDNAQHAAALRRRRARHVVGEPGRGRQRERVAAARLRQQGRAGLVAGDSRTFCVHAARRDAAADPTRAAPVRPPVSRACHAHSGGHPEGYLEAFAQLYRDLAEQIGAQREGPRPIRPACWCRASTTACAGCASSRAAVASSLADAAGPRSSP